MSAVLVKDSLKPNRRGDGANRDDKQRLHERPPGLSGCPGKKVEMVQGRH